MPCRGAVCGGRVRRCFPRRGHRGSPSRGRRSSACSPSCKTRGPVLCHAKQVTNVPGRDPVYVKVVCSHKNEVTPTPSRTCAAGLPRGPPRGSCVLPWAGGLRPRWPHTSRVLSDSSLSTQDKPVLQRRPQSPRSGPHCQTQGGPRISPGHSQPQQGDPHVTGDVGVCAGGDRAPGPPVALALTYQAEDQAEEQSSSCYVRKTKHRLNNSLHFKFWLHRVCLSAGCGQRPISP